MAHAAEIVKYFFLRLFAHRAGVEQNDVGLRRIVGRFHAIRGVQHIGHFFRVVLVHLAAESFDIKLVTHELFSALLKKEKTFFRFRYLLPFVLRFLHFIRR